MRSLSLIPILLGLLGLTSLVTGITGPLESVPKRSVSITTSSERLGLKWMGTNSSLPKILVLFTGGTIASGSALGPLDTTQYGQLQITAEELIARDPTLFKVSQLAVSNWTTETTSTGISDPLVMNMTRFTHDALCSEDSDIDGAVYTHGTNSLEETAFLLDLLVNCEKPIVGLGAMRPFTALSFDGDANFFQGVALAASPASRGRGVLVAFSDRILSGFWVTKMVPNFADGFGVTAGGDLGAFINNRPYFFNTPSTPIQKYEFDLQTVSAHNSFPSLPRVDILYAAREFDGYSALDAMNRGAEGVVIAGTGNGGLVNGDEQIGEAFDKGLYVVIGTRSPFGASTPALSPNIPKAGYIHVIQARIMLQLAIASGFSQNRTVELFEGSLREAIGQPFEYEE